MFRRDGASNTLGAMHRFYIDTPLPEHDAVASASPPLSVALDAEQAKHALRVLRLEAGDAVEVLDGAGGRGTGVLVVDEPQGQVDDQANRKRRNKPVGGHPCSVQLRAVNHEPSLSPRVEVWTAIPKGPRADDMINQLSQVGADQVTPMLTERSVVQPRPNKVERFAKLAREASKQCGRLHVMTVAAAKPLAEAFVDDCPASEDDPAAPSPLQLIACPAPLASSEPARAVTDWRDALSRVQAVRVLIGPEGGFTREEVEAAMAAGFRPWVLGPHVMRIETAAVVAVALLREAAMGQVERTRSP